MLMLIGLLHSFVKQVNICGCMALQNFASFGIKHLYVYSDHKLIELGVLSSIQSLCYTPVYMWEFSQVSVLEGRQCYNKVGNIIRNASHLPYLHPPPFCQE